ncbi:MAG: ClbS/DfsB family four-helix bundle protein [Roseiflexaceae bacterium]
MTETQSKSALLEQIDREQAMWEQLLAEIGEERMLEPGATDDWTFKDVVAHLNGWRIKTLARLDAAQHGHAPAAPPWPAELDENDDVDQINEWIYQANRDRSLQDVLKEYNDSFQRLRDVVTALPERDLTEIGYYPWLEDYTLANVITDSFGHLHEEHESVLRAWLDQGKHADA